MNIQETLTKAMTSRKAISFQYVRMGKSSGEKIGNAHVVFISNKFGKKSVVADVAADHLRGLKHFDVSSMKDVRILG